MKRETIEITLKVTDKHLNWLNMMAEKDNLSIDDGVSVMIINVLEKNKRKLKDEYKIYKAMKECVIDGN